MGRVDKACRFSERSSPAPFRQSAVRAGLVVESLGIEAERTAAEAGIRPQGRPGRKQARPAATPNASGSAASTRRGARGRGGAGKARRDDQGSRRPSWRSPSCGAVSRASTAEAHPPCRGVRQANGHFQQFHLASGAARPNCSSSRATIRSRPGSRSWRGRRARSATMTACRWGGAGADRDDDLCGVPHQPAPSACSMRSTHRSTTPMSSASRSCSTPCASAPKPASW